jgi:carbon-monoxide dehydrogenase small subunit
VNSCLLLAVDADGAVVVTAEGLARGGALHPVQEAFVEMGALQCGFCTPGMVMAAVALLDEHPIPDLEQMKRGLAGNLCRCTGYTKIFEAVQRASEAMTPDAEVRA